MLTLALRKLAALDDEVAASSSSSLLATSLVLAIAGFGGWEGGESVEPLVVGSSGQKMDGAPSAPSRRKMQNFQSAQLSGGQSRHAGSQVYSVTMHELESARIHLHHLFTALLPPCLR